MATVQEIGVIADQLFDIEALTLACTPTAVTKFLVVASEPGFGLGDGVMAVGSAQVLERPGSEPFPVVRPAFAFSFTRIFAVHLIVHLIHKFSVTNEEIEATKKLLTKQGES